VKNSTVIFWIRLLLRAILLADQDAPFYIKHVVDYAEDDEVPIDPKKLKHFLTVLRTEARQLLVLPEEEFLNLFSQLDGQLGNIEDAEVKKEHAAGNAS